MQLFIHILIIVPSLTLIFTDFYICYKQRKVILLPIQKYINNRCGVRGKIINLYNSYCTCSNKEILTQRQVVKVYSENPTIIDRLVELFSKLMFPLLTFIVLLTMNIVLKSLDSAKRNDVNTLLKVFEDIISGIYYGPVAFMLTATSCLIIVSLFSYIINEFHRSFLKLHEDVIDRIIKERKLEDAKLSDE